MIGGMVRREQAAARASNTDSSAAAVAAIAANMHRALLLIVCWLKWLKWPHLSHPFPLTQSSMQSLAIAMWALNFAYIQMSVSACYSPNSITPTLRQGPGQVSDKVANMSRTQIMKVRDTNHVANFHDLCPRQSPRTLRPTLSPTFPVHCNGLDSIRATQTGLLRTCHGLCYKHLDMSIWSVCPTFVICVQDFSHGEVSVKVGVMEFGVISAIAVN